MSDPKACHIKGWVTNGLVVHQQLVVELVPVIDRTIQWQVSAWILLSIKFLAPPDEVRELQFENCRELGLTELICICTSCCFF